MPIDPIHTLDTAAQWGPEIFLAVLIIIVGSGFLYFFGKQTFSVINNNTKALIEVSHMVALTNTVVGNHEKNSVESRQAVDHIDIKTGDIKNIVSDTNRLVREIVPQTERNK